MTKIPKQERTTVYELYTKGGLKQSEIARMYGVSRERMRQILADFSQKRRKKLDKR